MVVCAGLCALAVAIWLVGTDSAPPVEPVGLTPPEQAVEAERRRQFVDPRASEGDNSAARDVVQPGAQTETHAVEAAAVEPIAPELWRWQARLRLLDGSPAPRAQFVALVPGAQASLAWTMRSREPQPPEILARGWTDGDGLLEIEFPSTAVALGAADLHEVSHPRIAPNPQRIDFGDTQPVEIVYRAGSLDVDVLDPDGTPAKGARVVARWSDAFAEGPAGPPSYTAVTDESGRANLIFFEPGVGEIAVVGNNGSGVARLREVQFEPSRVDDGVTLVLGQEGMTGRLRVVLTSPGSTPVRDFALRLTSGALPSYHRYVDSRSIGPEGLIDGLPLGALGIEVSRVYREPPSLLLHDRIAPGSVELHADRIAEFRAVVPLAARWRLDIDADEESFAALEVHARRADRGEEKWKHERNVWQFDPTDGATTSLYISAPGVHYSHEMEPGVYDIELRRLAGGEVLWRSSVTLLEGEITPLSVQL